MKGQSLVIQFVLFFLIGFTLFIAIGNFFRLQSDIFKEDAASSSLKLTSRYLSSIMITANNCKQCDFINISTKIPETYAGYYLEMELNSRGLNVSAINNYFVSSVHNLNSTLYMSGKSSSAKPITLTYDKNKNKLEVS